MKRFSRTIFVLLIVTGSALSQTEDALVRLRLAQSLELAGDWERAVALYESLYRQAPANHVYFDGLRRAYVQLKDYRKAVELVLFRLQLQQNDPSLLSSLGGLYYQMGNETQADSIWTSILAGNPTNASLYRLVASQQMEFRLYDQAIQTFVAGRKATGSEILFVEELASLYGAFQQYDKAADEYLRMLRSQPQQLSYIQSRLSIFLNRPEALKPIRQRVQEEVRQAESLVAIRQLNAWLQMEGKDYDAALEEYRLIDRMTGASGAELFNFGQRAMQERAYLAAARAFREVIEKRPSTTILPMARFNYARTIEELSLSADTSVGEVPAVETPAWPVSETRPTFGGAINLYQALRKDFPNTELAGRSLFRIGIIRKERLFDLDGALTAFEQVRGMWPSHAVAADATMEIAEVLTLKSALEQARSEYRALLALNRPEIRDRARYRMAEIDYFRGLFDSTTVILEPLTSNAQNDLANDALVLHYFIQENRVTAPSALAEFARADLLMRQRKFSEALERFKAITTTHPSALLVDDAFLRIAELHLVLQHPMAAVQTLEAIVNDMPLSILRDRALMKMGEVYERTLMNPAKALETYEQLLARHPNSVYVEEARRRIRTLRGDAI